MNAMELSPSAGPDPIAGLKLVGGYVGVAAVAAAVTLVATPIMRRLALANGVVDHPAPRKIHRAPVPYLGGVAVFLGLMGAIVYSYAALAWPGLVRFHDSDHRVLLGADLVHAPVPWSILLGLTVIMLVGLLDDVMGIPPRIKVGGQLVAAAALAIDEVGVRSPAFVLRPIGRALGLPTMDLPDGTWTLGFQMQLPVPVPLMGDVITIDFIYWAGTAMIAIFVLGACNAANLIDGLDGLLAGTTAICAAGLAIVGGILAALDDGARDAQRIVLCMALLGACVGFLPYNFNPARIFLGDCGSLLLGFTSIVIVLTLGDTGQTYYVLAGLVIFAIPIADTVLAIVRRRVAGRPITEPDANHLHHLLRQRLGVRGAVLTLYGLAAVLALVGIALIELPKRYTYGSVAIGALVLVAVGMRMGRRMRAAASTKG